MAGEGFLGQILKKINGFVFKTTTPLAKNVVSKTTHSSNAPIIENVSEYFIRVKRNIEYRRLPNTKLFMDY